MHQLAPLVPQALIWIVFGAMHYLCSLLREQGKPESSAPACSASSSICISVVAASVLALEPLALFLIVCACWWAYNARKRSCSGILGRYSGAFCELWPGLAALDFTARGFTGGCTCMTGSMAAFGDVRSFFCTGGGAMCAERHKSP